MHYTSPNDLITASFWNSKIFKIVYNLSDLVTNKYLIMHSLVASEGIVVLVQLVDDHALKNVIVQLIAVKVN